MFHNVPCLYLTAVVGSHQDVLYVEPFFIFINDIQERNPSYHHLNLNVCYADDYFLTLSAIDDPATLKEELNLSNRKRFPCLHSLI